MSLDKFPQTARGKTEKYRRGRPKCTSKRLEGTLKGACTRPGQIPAWVQNPTFGSNFGTFCMVRSVEHHGWESLYVLDGFKSFYDVPGWISPERTRYNTKISPGESEMYFKTAEKGSVRDPGQIPDLDSKSNFWLKIRNFLHGSLGRASR